MKHDLLRAANVMALAGLVAVALAITGAVLLVVSVVYDGLVAALVAAGAAGVYSVLWFVVPHFGHRDQPY